jgi:hypothetical protein
VYIWIAKACPNHAGKVALPKVRKATSHYWTVVYLDDVRDQMTDVLCKSNRKIAYREQQTGR